jgi:hypothetical protein
VIIVIAEGKEDFSYTIPRVAALMGELNQLQGKKISRAQLYKNAKSFVNLLPELLEAPIGELKD